MDIEQQQERRAVAWKATSQYIEFIDRDTEIDYKSALSEMSSKFDELKKRWDANETELINAFKVLGYGEE